MALTLKKIEVLCQKKFPCKIQDGGFDDHKYGYRTVKIIVGQKPNPAFETNSEDRKKLIKGDPRRRANMPDVRIVFVPGNADISWLKKQIIKIYKTLPENQTINMKKLDHNVSSIDKDPELQYKHENKDKEKDGWDDVEEDKDKTTDDDFEEDWDDEDEDEDIDDFGDDDDDEKEPIEKQMDKADEEEEMMEGVGKLSNAVNDLAEGQKKMMDVLNGFDKRIGSIEDKTATKSDSAKTTKTKPQTPKGEGK